MKLQKVIRENFLGCLALLAYGILFLLRTPCLFETFLHIPCPGCGMTSAWYAALHLRFAAAFRQHMMFWSLPLLAVAIFRGGRFTGKRWVDRGILIALAAGFLANYIRQLVLYFAG